MNRVGRARQLRYRALHYLLVLAAALVFGHAALAQEFPSRPVSLVVPFPPGGALDLTGRLLAKELQDLWGQPVPVVNKASPIVGTDFVVKSNADGYTIVIMPSTPLISAPHLQKVPYDVLKDLAPITQTTLLTYALVATTKTGISSIEQLIQRARQAPGQLNYASGGNGSGQHLYIELFKEAAKVHITHIPYRGTGPALQALMAEQVDLMFETTLTALPLVKAGKVRALMVTGATALPQFPGAVPQDLLFPGLGIPGWYGVFAPSATPLSVRERLAQGIQQVLALPAVDRRFR